MPLVTRLRTRVAVILAAVAVTATCALLATGTLVLNRAFYTLEERATRPAPAPTPVEGASSRMAADVVNVRRDIETERQRTLLMLGSEALAAGLCFVAAAFVLLDRQVLRRTTALATFVRAIDHAND
jgi:hypothetical protein